MIKLLKVSSLVVLIAFFSIKGYCQEVIGLTENKVIKNQLEKYKSRKKSTESIDTLNIPFFDDFSTSNIFPDEELWEDRYAFINSSYPLEPLSIGVASLDAIDAEGNVYATDNDITPSDTLTSRPIDLSEFKGSGQPVTLSFWYQAGGKGELPEEKDTLLLEFFSPEDTAWTGSVWKAETWPADTFIQVILSIDDSLFQNGFKFRFRNYTSISINDVTQGKGALSNADQWHLDYIQLDNRSVEEHPKINDISFIEPLRSTLRNYESVPWSHIDNVITDERLDTIPVFIRNAYERLFPPDDSTAVTRQYYVKDLNDNSYFIEPYPDNGITEQFLNNSVIDRGDRFKPYYQQTEADAGLFEIAAYFRNTEHYKGNDTVKRIEKFLDYYAYDDGTAEYGFGISGESSRGALLAYRFKLYRTDTLRAIDFYFNKTRNNFNATKSFKICIWDNYKGSPGELIYPEDLELSPLSYPDSSKGLNEFTRYSFDSLLIVSDTIFVGWQQTTEEFLNVGYDINNANKKNILTNITGNWIPFNNSPYIEGSLMIRLICGTRQLTTSINSFDRAGGEFISLYPNPASEYINIQFPLSLNDSPVSVSIYDFFGKPVYISDEISPVINISGLKPGLYILRIAGLELDAINRKFIISR
ncbi:MAG: T9SS type A sorting domain-containing protein [Bacteroidales bacterium]|nr:MAG: T9SS type A sorting domain-containing protein [Bacteroidales bacterium]